MVLPKVKGGILAGRAFLTWVTVVGLTGAIAGILTFLVSLGVGLLPAVSLTAGVVLGILVILAFANSRYGVKGLFLKAVRRRMMLSLASVVIEEWTTNVKIDENGGARVTNHIEGKVNFGINSYIPTRLKCADTSAGPIDVKAIDEETGRDLFLEPILTTPNFTEFKIHFPEQKTRGDTFEILLEYGVRETFFFDKQDHYSHKASHFERKISIIIEFPPNVIVTEVNRTVETQHGDIWGDAETPVLENGQRLSWTITGAYLGNLYKMIWDSRTVKPSRPAT